MTERQLLNKEVAKELDVPINIVEQVVAHQWKTALENVNKCDRMEVTGFGEFRISFRKVKVNIYKMNKRIDETKKKLEKGFDEKLAKKLGQYEEILNFLISKDGK